MVVWELYGGLEDGRIKLQIIVVPTSDVNRTKHSPGTIIIALKPCHTSNCQNRTVVRGRQQRKSLHEAFICMVLLPCSARNTGYNTCSERITLQLTHSLQLLHLLQFLPLHRQVRLHVPSAVRMCGSPKPNYQASFRTSRLL